MIFGSAIIAISGGGITRWVRNLSMADRPTILTDEQVSQIRGEKIQSVFSVRGRPGGANNDHITLQFESGKLLSLSIYALYETVASVKE